MPPSSKGQIQLSKFAFWDIDLAKLDFERYVDFIIIRVFERGTIEDVNKVINYYGERRVIQSLTSATILLNRAVRLGEYLFGLSRHQFKCSNDSQPLMDYSKY